MLNLTRNNYEHAHRPFSLNSYIYMSLTTSQDISRCSVSTVKNCSQVISKKARVYLITPIYLQENGTSSDFKTYRRKNSRL